MPNHYKMPVARNRYTGPTNDGIEAPPICSVVALYAIDTFVDDEKIGF
jgi:hypothetical protein